MNKILLAIVLLFASYVAYCKINQVTHPPDKVHLDKEYQVASYKELSNLVKEIEASLPEFRPIKPYSKTYFTDFEKRFSTQKDMLGDITDNLGKSTDIKIMPAKNPNTIVVYATFVGECW